MKDDSSNLNEFIEMAVNKYSLIIAKTAFAYLKNTVIAEDITQDVFLTLLLKHPKFENEDHLKAWLIRVAVNKSKNHLKSGWFKNNNKIPEELSYEQPGQSNLLSAVLTLDIKYRLPIHLYYYEGYSIKEIAKILQQKPATITTRLARGRNRLKKLIGEMDDE